MIPNKFAQYAFSFFMALLMSGLMSFVITLYNLGWVEDILFVWLKAWQFAFIVAFPSIVLLSPVVRFLVTMVVKQESQD